MGAIRKRDGYDWKFEAEEQQRRVARLEGALRSLLQATSDQVVLRPSQQEAWRAAERVLLKQYD